MDVQLKFDGKAELLGSVRSDLDLEGFKVWFGPGAAPFWESLKLRSPPRITAEVTGAGLNLDLIRAEGRVEVQNLSYKGVEMEELAGNVILAGGQLTVKELKVKSSGGEGSGDFDKDLPSLDLHHHVHPRKFQNLTRHLIFHPFRS